jgi:hypothetical protein
MAEDNPNDLTDLLLIPYVHILDAAPHRVKAIPQHMALILTYETRDDPRPLLDEARRKMLGDAEHFALMQSPLYYN